MKAVLKILTALAALVGVAYVIATYGDKIVAWAKNLLGTCPITEEDFEDEAAEEEAAEEEAAEEEAAEEEAAEVEVVIEENEPVAEEADFEA